MAWLLPVGTPGGICSGLDEIPDGSGIVRLGEQTMYLDPAMYRVWRAAAAAPQIEELIDWATTQGIGEAESLIRDLEGADLWMFAQSVGQFQTAYENADGMLGSCAVRIYMNPGGADGLAERLSEELGYVDSVNDNTRRRLVEAAELSGPAYQDLQIVFAGGAKPAKVTTDFAYNDPSSHIAWRCRCPRRRHARQRTRRPWSPSPSSNPSRLRLRPASSRARRPDPSRLAHVQMRHRPNTAVRSHGSL
jgi:TraM recognition site of TraD and TraG